MNTTPPINPHSPSSTYVVQTSKTSGVPLYTQNRRDQETPHSAVTHTINRTLVATVIEMNAIQQEAAGVEPSMQYRILLRIHQNTLSLISDIPFRIGDTIQIQQTASGKWRLDVSYLHSSSSADNRASQSTTVGQAFYQWFSEHNTMLSTVMNSLYTLRHQILSVLAYKTDTTPYTTAFMQLTPIIDSVLAKTMQVEHLSTDSLKKFLGQSGLFLQHQLAASAHMPASKQSQTLQKDLQAQLGQLYNKLHDLSILWQQHNLHSHAPPSMSPLYPKSLARLARQWLDSSRLTQPSINTTLGNSTHPSLPLPPLFIDSVPEFLTSPNKTITDTQSKTYQHDPIIALLRLLKHLSRQGLNRIHTQQLTSLLHTAATSETQFQRANHGLFFEIPLFFDGQIQHIKLMIDNPTNSSQQKKTRSLAKRWRFLLTFDLGVIGEVFAQGALVGKQLDLQFFSTDKHTQKMINDHANWIIKTFEAAGIECNPNNDKGTISQHGKPDVSKTPFHQDWTPQ